MRRGASSETRGTNCEGDGRFVRAEKIGGEGEEGREGRQRGRKGERKRQSRTWRDASLHVHTCIDTDIYARQLIMSKSFDLSLAFMEGN